MLHQQKLSRSSGSPCNIDIINSMYPHIRTCLRALRQKYEYGTTTNTFALHRSCGSIYSGLKDNVTPQTRAYHENIHENRLQVCTGLIRLSPSTRSRLLDTHLCMSPGIKYSRAHRHANTVLYLAQPTAVLQHSMPIVNQ